MSTEAVRLIPVKFGKTNTPVSDLYPGESDTVTILLRLVSRDCAIDSGIATPAASRGIPMMQDFRSTSERPDEENFERRIAALEARIDSRFDDLIQWSFVFWFGWAAVSLLGR